MRRPHMSLGSWIFASVLVAVLVPTGAWAATAKPKPTYLTSSTGSTPVAVTGTGQLLTATVPPSDVVSILGVATPQNGTCTTAYTPPSGDALILTSVTYTLGSGTEGTAQYVGLEDCAANGRTLDSAETIHAHDAQSRTFPVGLPVTSIGIYVSGGTSEAILDATGYLVPATELSAAERARRASPPAPRRRPAS